MATVDRLSSAAEGAAERIADVTSQATEVMSEKGEQLMNMEKRFIKQLRTHVRDYPIASIGIALAAGFVLSQLVLPYPYRDR